MSLVQFHAGLSNACVLFSLIIAGYGFLLYLQNRGVEGGYLGVIAIGELLFIAQIVVGVLLAFSGVPRPARLWVHVLYGTVLVIMYPAAYAFTRGRDGRPEALTYAVVGLFLAGIALRAMETSSLVAPVGLDG